MHEDTKTSAQSRYFKCLISGEGFICFSQSGRDVAGHPPLDTAQLQPQPKVVASSCKQFQTVLRIGLRWSGGSRNKEARFGGYGCAFMSCVFSFSYCRCLLGFVHHLLMALGNRLLFIAMLFSHVMTHQRIKWLHTSHTPLLSSLAVPAHFSWVGAGGNASIGGWAPQFLTVQWGSLRPRLISCIALLMPMVFLICIETDS